MAGFMYFVTKRIGTLTEDEAASLGLSYWYRNGVSAAEVFKGPDNLHGTLLFDTSQQEGQSTGFFAARQEWTKSWTNNFWVGRWKGVAVSPSDLALPTMLDGRNVRLCDGNDWYFPSVRLVVESGDQYSYVSNLPHSVQKGSDGHWSRGEIIPRYRTIWDAVESWQEAIRRHRENPNDYEAAQANYDTVFESIVTLIGANYRIGPDEVGILGLLDDRETIAKVLRAALDTDKLEEWQKKTQVTEGSDTGPTEPGAEDSTPTTGQPSQS